jgi:hypothetical protein
VALAIPFTSTHTMKTMRSVTGIRFPEAFTFATKLIEGPGGGVLSGFIIAHTAM